MKKNLLALLLSLTLLAPAGGVLAQQQQQTTVKITSAERKMVEAITAAQLKDYLYFIASDEMEGRDTPSRGLDLTAKFIAMNLSRWGVKPAGDDGTYFQKIALRSDAPDAAKTTLQIGAQSFQFNEDFLRLSGSGSATGAPLVFGGSGWMIKSKNIDALQGVDARGKIVVLYSEGVPGRNRLTALPAGVTPADLNGANGADWADPLTNARGKGAVGVILVASPQAQAAWPQYRNFLSRGNLYPEKLRRQNSGDGGNEDAAGNGGSNGQGSSSSSSNGNIPLFLASQKVGYAIFAGESGDNKTTPAFAINKTATMNVAPGTDVKWTQNVVAVIEGSDPVLKNEYVAIGAHYDHVGTNPNAPGNDKIWNGADDDGSGTTAVLAIAETLAKLPKKPKRSVLFVWHAGEEKGLWGSEYFVNYPTVDLKNVVAQLNIDMIGRSKAPGDENPKNAELSGANEIYVIGSEMMSSQLGQVTKGVNDSFLKINYNYKYDDPKDKNQFFFRSDHFHYASKNIPIAFWFSGTHEDYHGAGDHADKIDYAKMEKVTRTILLTLWELSEAKTRPAVDKQLPPELTRR